jgi:hypothetical protein
MERDMDLEGLLSKNIIKFKYFIIFLLKIFIWFLIIKILIFLKISKFFLFITKKISSFSLKKYNYSTN